MTRCTQTVAVPQMAFPRFKKCARQAVTKDENGNPVCLQHSPEKVEARRVAREALGVRRRNEYFAYLKMKAAKK